MAQAQTAALPIGLDLDLGCSIVFEAVDPTTGNPVTGVTISSALIRVEMALAGGGGTSELGSGAFVLIPGPGV